MSDEKVLEILCMLVSMTEEHFQEYIEYVKNTEMQQDTREFLQLALKIANEKRQSLSA